MQKNKSLYIAFIAVFLSVLIAIPLLTSLSSSGGVSPYEYRTLQKTPVLTRERYFSGDYFEELENYYKDNIAGRNEFMSASVFIKSRVLGKHIVNGVFEADGHILPAVSYKAPMTDIELQADEAAERTLTVALQTQSYGGVFLYAAMPSQTTAFWDLYKTFSDRKNQEAINKAFLAALSERGVPYVDMYGGFAQEGGFDAYYYKTDHHINLRGALLTCAAIENALEPLGISFTAPAENDLNITTLPNDFLGSRGRRLFGLSPVNDKLEVFSYKTPVAFTRTDNGKTVEPTVLSLPQAGGFATYSVFMGGDIAETVIETNRPELPNLLIYGDSLTNVLESLLYAGFNEMRSLDLRYYSQTDILDYISTYRPDVVLLVRDDHMFLDATGNGAVGG